MLRRPVLVLLAVALAASVVAGGDAVPTVSASPLFVGCGSAERQCTFTSHDDLIPVEEVDCWWVYEGGSTDVDIARPTVDGDLAPYAALYAPGATLVQRSASAGPDLPWSSGRSLGSIFVCGAVEGCSYVGGDLVLGGNELTLSAG